MKPARFDYACPETLAQAVALLGRPNAKAMAGGQSLMPLLAFRLAQPQLIVDLKRVPGLDRIEIGAGTAGVTLGAKVRWVDIEQHQQLATAHPLLTDAVRHIAHYQIRNRGTIGGSLAHADPAAEMPGIAVACEAKIHVTGPKGARVIAADDFFVSALQTTLAPDELITHVVFPVWPKARRWGFLEFARRRGDFAMAGVAAFYDTDSNGKATNTHIAAIGMGDRARRLATAEAALDGRLVDATSIAAAARAASSDVQPNGDIHASPEYRRALVATLTERVLTKAAN